MFKRPCHLTWALTSFCPSEATGFIASLYTQGRQIHKGESDGTDYFCNTMLRPLTSAKAGSFLRFETNKCSFMLEHVKGFRDLCHSLTLSSALISSFPRFW